MGSTTKGLGCRSGYLMSYGRKYVAAALALSVLAGDGFARPSVAAMAAPVSEAGALQSHLPDCVSSASTIAEIRRLQKANGKTPRKYDGYRQVFHARPPLELAARLAYAETSAANCPKQEGQIADLVASVIGNRIRIRHGGVAGVVFQRDQFASSLNIYPESRYRDFLCPHDGELWQRVVATMRVNLEGPKPTASIPKDAVNYYLYRHSDRFEAPAWRLEEIPIPDEKTRECIRVFRDPAWK